jgi:beta-phosphoglucomutase
VRGVIFDMDGVLVLTAPAHYRAWQEAAARDGIDLGYELFTHTFGRTNPDVIRMIWRAELAADRVADIAERKERRFREIFAEDMPLAPGLEPLLVELCEAGFVLGVGSSAPPENIDLVLDRGGLRRYFAAIADGTEVRRGKPAPDVFLLAAQKAGLAPERCAVVEDAPAGIEAAVAAGMTPIGIGTTHPLEDLRRAGAVETFATLRELTATGLLAAVRGAG